MDDAIAKFRATARRLYPEKIAGSLCIIEHIAIAHEAAARRFLKRAIDRHGKPKTITIDKSGAHTAAIGSYNKDYKAHIKRRQCEYLNNIVEQDHRAIKRITRPMLGFKSFRCARILLAGIEIMHIIRKGQLAPPSRQVASAAERFYSLAY